MVKASHKAKLNVSEKECVLCSNEEGEGNECLLEKGLAHGPWTLTAVGLWDFLEKGECGQGGVEGQSQALGSTRSLKTIRERNW
jgi:hypothetical protein